MLEKNLESGRSPRGPPFGVSVSGSSIGGQWRDGRPHAISPDACKKVSPCIISLALTCANSLFAGASQDRERREHAFGARCCVL